MNTQTSFPPSVDIAVVGSGLVGMAAALGLAQQGWRVALLGPTPPASAVTQEDDWDSRIYALSPATQALLTRLQIWQHLPGARLQPVREMQVFAAPASPEPNPPLHFSAYQAAVPELAWIAEGRLIGAALAHACRYQTTLHWLPSPAAGWAYTDEGVELTLADDQHILATLVLAADGADSWVRDQIGVVTRSHDYQQTAVVANFRCSQAHAGTAWQWFRPDGILALLPLPGERVSMVWSANQAQHETLLAYRPDELAQAVSAACAGMLGELHTLTAPQAFPLRLQTCSNLIAKRVALLGDAAHVLHPLAGQGMNLGMGDVATLLNVLASREPVRTLADPRLLERYARRRAWPVAALRGLTDGLQKLFASQHSGAYFVRQTGMQALNLPIFQPLKKKLIQHAIHS